MAAHSIIAGEQSAIVAGGLDSISLVQNEHFNHYMDEDPWLLEHKPEIYMSMIDTAENVAQPLWRDPGAAGRVLA